MWQVIVVSYEDGEAWTEHFVTKAEADERAEYQWNEGNRAKVRWITCEQYLKVA